MGSLPRTPQGPRRQGRLSPGADEETEARHLSDLSPPRSWETGVGLDACVLAKSRINFEILPGSKNPWFFLFSSRLPDFLLPLPGLSLLRARPSSVMLLLVFLRFVSLFACRVCLSVSPTRGCFPRLSVRLCLPPAPRFPSLPLPPSLSPSSRAFSPTATTQTPLWRRERLQGLAVVRACRNPAGRALCLLCTWGSDSADSARPRATAPARSWPSPLSWRGRAAGRG